MPVFFMHNDPVILIKHQGSYHNHFHYEAELIYVIEGSYRIKLKDEQYDLKTGDVWLAFPFEEHKYEYIGENTIMIAIFSPEHIGAIGNKLMFNRSEYPVVNVSNMPGYGEFLIRIAQLWMFNFEREKHYGQGSGDNIYDKAFEKYILPCETILTMLSAAVGELLENIKLTPKNSPGVCSIQRIIEYCSKNINDPELSMDKLSAAVGLSRSQISRLISHYIKMSFPEFLHSERMTYARNMLKFSDKAITDIALECGFQSQRSFNRIFRDMMGMTPSEWRIKCKARGDNEI